MADVAIEPEKDGNQLNSTLPINPPDLVHIAIKDIENFGIDSGGDKRDKEYEVCDESDDLFI